MDERARVARSFHAPRSNNKLLRDRRDDEEEPALRQRLPDAHARPRPEQHQMLAVRVRRCDHLAILQKALGDELFNGFSQKF